ncbi:MAG: M20 family metallopeptidase [Emergencia sp.]
MKDYNEISERIIKYRRDLHQIPELSFDLPETGTYIRKVLAKLSCGMEDIAGYGVAAFFDFGRDDALCFRCDMDALPIQEVNELPFISRHEGKMHACGHDSHMAIMLGFAELIEELKSQGFSPSHNAVLLFQPAEETIDGALKICQTDFLEKYNVSSVFGLHNWPTLPKGQISSISGPMMAKSTSVDVSFDGVSAHCGEPWKGRDAMFAAVKFISEIYDFCNREDDSCIIRFGKLTSGTVRNAISPKSELMGTIRTFSEDTWNGIIREMDRISDEIYKEMEVTVRPEIVRYHPAVINNPALYERIIPYLDELGYKELDKPVMIAEDFSFYQEKVPGIFFFLGTGSGIPLHSVNYDMDDSVIIQGVKLFEAILKNL